MLGVALCVETASGQDTTGEVFASYALDFCAALVDGAPWAAAAQAANLPSPAAAVRYRAADVPSQIAEWLQADKDTFLYATSHVDDVFAVVRTDPVRCVVQAFDRQSPLTALRRRLDDEQGPWQEQVSFEDGAVYQRNATDPTAGGILLHFQFSEAYSGVLAERTDGRILKLTKEQRAVWATTIVSQCAAGVHQDMPLSPASFAPFFVVIDERAALLGGVLGHPSGTLALHSRRNSRACDVAVATGGVADLERAVREALLASGATQHRDGTYHVPKPPDAPGQDAVFSIDRSGGPLEIRVERP